MNDDFGLLSIDFMAGFTIFMIALIIVITMSSGLLIGLQSKTIDYDAVAYRTGVILAEDPGEANVTDSAGNPITTDSASWELVYLPPKEDPLADHYKSYISRMGLAIPKAYDNPDILSQQQSPNILSLDKVKRFFNTSLFYDYDRPDPLNPFNTIPSDYREKVIFGDYPYKFNITLDSINSGDSIHESVGDSNIPNISYGYIRRIVLVKDPTATYSAPSTPGNSNQINISMDFNQLDNYSSPRGPIYQIDPNKDEIVLNISGFNSVNYTNQTPRIKLKSINIARYDNLTSQYSGLVIYTTSPTVKVYLNESNDSNPNESNRWISGTNDLVTSNILIIFESGYFSRTSDYQSVKTSLIFGNLIFDTDNQVGQGTGSSFAYNYSLQTGANPVLKPCVLEVKIW